MPGGDYKAQQPSYFLHATTARVAARPPLTPKVATAAAAATKTSAKNSPVVTPLGRRAQNAAPVSSENGPTPKDDSVSLAPAGSLLPSNITPRSGKRQIRAESVNNTPVGTPTLERTSVVSGLAGNKEGTGSVLSSAEPRPTPQIESPDPERNARFFYASDAKQTQQALPRPLSGPQQQKAATFFYANGANIENRRKVTPPMNLSAPSLVPPDQAPTKFFYANGTPDGPATRPTLTHSPSASTISSTSKTPGSTSTFNTGQAPLTYRPSSPIKLTSVPATQSAKGTVPMATSATANRPQLLPQPPSSSSLSVGSSEKRRVSIDAAPRQGPSGHTRTGSVPMAGGPLMAPPYASPTRMSPEPVPSSPPLSPALTNSAMTMATILQAVEGLTPDELPNQGEYLPAEPQSPTKSSHESEAVNELVANARRERKVQDLEITNASLEAINRTLEKQLRKQTAELRRFRRLSRTGRFSLASSRVTSAAQDELSIKLSDLIEDEDETDEEEEEDEEGEGGDSMYDSEPSSTGADGEEPLRLSRRRRRDEKRLQLDLAKHQELLVDSQKMNQSIKRCLDWTEVLIKEGHKALAYYVRPSEVEFGGRVLAPADDHQEDSQIQNEVDDELPIPGQGLAIRDEPKDTEACEADIRTSSSVL